MSKTYTAPTQTLNLNLKPKSILDQLSEDDYLVVNDNLTLTAENIKEVTKLTEPNAINLMFPTVKDPSKPKKQGDVRFNISIKVPNEEDPEYKKTKILTVQKELTRNVERFLIKLIQGNEIEYDDKKFLISILNTAFTQYMLGVIRKYYKDKLNHIKEEDMMQSFRVGFLDALRTYDLNNAKEARFTTYVFNLFVKEANNLTNQISPVKNTTSKMAQKARTLLLRLIREKGELKHKDYEFVAKEVNTSVTNIITVANSLNAKSLNQNVGDEDGSELIDNLADTSHNLEDSVVLRDTLDNLGNLTLKFIERLDEKEQLIFVFRIIAQYIIDNDIENFKNYKEYFITNSITKELTLQQLGKNLEISAERVRQIQTDLEKKYEDFIKTNMKMPNYEEY